MRGVARWLGQGLFIVAFALGGLAVAPVAAQAATVTMSVKVTGTLLKIRSGPTTASPITGTLPNKAKVSIVCQVTGLTIKGSVRRTNLWDRLTNGRYISHAYVVGTRRIARCPAAAAPAPILTNEQFIAASVAGAQRGWREYGVPPSVTIAQAVLESGWGRSLLSRNDRNYFGIKCFGTPGTIAKGCHTYRTTECDKAGKCLTTTATFRVYASTADSYRDHGYFLRTNKRYNGAFAYTKDANRFLVAIWKAGYATDPKYDVKLKTLMTTYNLYRYDTWK